ncbi:hypothetical protein [Sphingopyxis sp. BSNA05]|nr:hypothetical protein [Sphingopyxis sp. BSNA05]
MSNFISIVTLNLFQGPSRLMIQAASANKGVLKQVQHDETRVAA